MNPSSHEVRSLIDAARESNRDSLTPLLERYRRYLNWLARNPGSTGRCKPKRAYSDLVQQTMLHRDQHGFGDFRGHTDAELAAWLRKILVRNLTELVRQYQTAARQISRSVDG